MKIYLLDKNRNIVERWKAHFNGVRNVEIKNIRLNDFLDEYDVQCIVSPANSYGLMDGGYDRAISEYFGWDIINVVQAKIIEKHFGEQTVGTSLIVRIPRTDKFLIHTPTMRVPSLIKDPMVVYFAMRSTLICALRNNIRSIVIPAFGGACGGLDPDVIAYMMKEAYDQVMNPPSRLDWNYAGRVNLEDE